MAKEITFRLEAQDVFQILDALDTRAESWENTEAVLNGTFESEDIFIPEECDDSEEAAEIAQHFREIISKMKAQIGEV